jgi:uncharacterized protein (DUF1501 family)
MPLSRRELLKTFGAATVASLGPALPAVVCHGFAEAVPGADRKPQMGQNLLVLVQLAGGNDGLNTVVPYADDLYAKNRHTLRLTEKQVLKIDSLLGFHPEMTAFKRLYDEGLLSVVQGVGNANPHGGHGESMRFWHTARPHETNVQTGWVGRAADLASRPGESDLPAVFLGHIHRPFVINAEKTFVPAIRDLEHTTLRGVGDEGRTDLKSVPRAGRGAGDRDNPLLGLVEQTTTAACAASRRIETVLQSSRSGREYPQSEFAQMLKGVSQLIRADLGIRIFVTEVGGEEPGGWDTHAVQFANHAALLKQLSEGIAAFATDLKADRLLDRVVLVTFSEFGRTLAENGRRGTDHGSAAPMFLVGGKLKGGLIGPHPNLTLREGAGGVMHHTDFRRVYATLLDRWLGWDSRPILGGSFAPVDALKA